MMCTGNLLHRWDKQKLRKEVFTYDGLDRLASAQVHTVNASGGIVQSNPAISYTYDGTVGGTTKGNLATRTDIGKFSTILWRERLRSCLLHPLGSASARAKADCAN
ncbi:MAG: hypothetical protein JSS84_03145 [Bacteroidetes bacterium]|nr:hypothetical protein [Bacteroidota bacterium]